MVPDVRLEVDDRKDINVAVDNNQVVSLEVDDRKDINVAVDNNQVVSSLVVVNTDEESNR